MLQIVQQTPKKHHSGSMAFYVRLSERIIRSIEVVDVPQVIDHSLYGNMFVHALSLSLLEMRHCLSSDRSAFDMSPDFESYVKHHQFHSKTCRRVYNVFLLVSGS
jgi:hypothetical protein